MATSSRRSSARSPHAQMVFSSRNYTVLLIALAVIVAGFAIMRIENDLNGVISLYVAPILILGGYLSIVYAILRQPGHEEETVAEEPAAK